MMAMRRLRARPEPDQHPAAASGRIGATNGPPVWVAKAKYICLVNLILDKPAVKELIQQDLNENMLVESLKAIVSGPKRNELLIEYKNVQSLLQAGNVSAKIAEDMYRCLVKTNERA